METLSKKKEIWQHIVFRFSSTLRPKDFKTWFSPISLKTLDNNLAVIEVPNRFFADWVRERYLGDLQSAFRELTGRVTEIRFAVRNRPGKSGSFSHPFHTVPIPFPSHELYYDMTFERFIRTEANSFAYFSCLEIASKNYLPYSPLYLFSPKSVGKTHLLHAVGNRMREIDPGCRIRYIHSDRFTNEFTQAMRTGQLHSFRGLFSELDILLFDDVHLLSGRIRTQQEFALALNALLRRGKTVVTAARTAPFRLEDIDARLKSILGWGLLVEIQPPDVEMLVRFIEQYTASNDIHVPDEIKFFLAKSNDDMKTLIRNLTRLQAHISLNGGDISLSTVRKTMMHQSYKTLEIKDIQLATAGYFNVSLSDLLSDNRRRPISYARRMAMYLCKEHTQNSYKKISLSFLKKDHSTVIYAIKSIKNELLTKEKTKEDLTNLEKIILF